jgi:hypothetical protein
MPTPHPAGRVAGRCALALTLAATALAAWMLVVGTYNPFIYFRF